MSRFGLITSDRFALPKCRLSYLHFFKPGDKQAPKPGAVLVFPPTSDLTKLTEELDICRKRFKEVSGKPASRPPKVRTFPFDSETTGEPVLGPTGCEDWLSIKASFKPFPNGDGGLELKAFVSGEHKTVPETNFYSGCWAIPIVEIISYPKGTGSDGKVYSGGLKLQVLCLQFVSDGDRFSGHGSRANFDAYLQPVEAEFKSFYNLNDDDEF